MGQPDSDPRVSSEPCRTLHPPPLLWPPPPPAGTSPLYLLLPRARPRSGCLGKGSGRRSKDAPWGPFPLGINWGTPSWGEGAGELLIGRRPPCSFLREGRERNGGLGVGSGVWVPPHQPTSAAAPQPPGKQVSSMTPPPPFTGGETEARGSPAVGDTWATLSPPPPPPSPRHWDQCQGCASLRKGLHCLICGCEMSVNKGGQSSVVAVPGLWGSRGGGSTRGFPLLPPLVPSASCVTRLQLCPAVPKPGAFLGKNVKAPEFGRTLRAAATGPLCRGGAAGGGQWGLMGGGGVTPGGNRGPMGATVSHVGGTQAENVLNSVHR